MLGALARKLFAAAMTVLIPLLAFMYPLFVFRTFCLPGSPKLLMVVPYCQAVPGLSSGKT